MAGLYGGTSSSLLYQYTPNSPPLALLNNASSAAGAIGPFQVLCNANAASGAVAIPGIASGTPIGAATPWFQVKVWDSAYASYAAALAAGSAYVGQGPLFQLNPGPGLTYTFTAPAGPNSSWTDTPIIVAAPEPSTFALAGLGAAALMIFRRRK
ncbi:MAG TPA: PEP-CTERM sorting domain-containing protein [Terriglobales bacterium]|nr:PEP-CTERM sorting domain-containing protein [Terriglobales bacterium]